MAAFATTDDLAARWRLLSETEEITATALLDDASAFVRAECRGIDQRITDDLLDAAIPLAVVCSMVKRAMAAGDLAGVASQQEMAGPFSRGLTFSNPTGDLYLSKQERRHLGFGGVRAGNVGLAPVALFVESD